MALEMGQRLGGSSWGAAGVSEGDEPVWGDVSVKLRNRGIAGDAGGFGSLSHTNESRSLPRENVVLGGLGGNTGVYVGVSDLPLSCALLRDSNNTGWEGSPRPPAHAGQGLGTERKGSLEQQKHERERWSPWNGNMQRRRQRAAACCVLEAGELSLGHTGLTVPWI